MIELSVDKQNLRKVKTMEIFESEKVDRKRKTWVVLLFWTFSLLYLTILLHLNTYKIIYFTFQHIIESKHKIYLKLIAGVSTSEQFRTRLQAYGLKKKTAKDFISPTQYQNAATSVTSAVRKREKYGNSAWLHPGKASWCPPGRKKNGRQQTKRRTIRTAENRITSPEQ